MTTSCEETPPLLLVKFTFSSDDAKFNLRLFEAIDTKQCPDFACSLGSPSGTGNSYTALWRAEHADAVRDWARTAGVVLSPAAVPLADVAPGDDGLGRDFGNGGRWEGHKRS